MPFLSPAKLLVVLVVALVVLGPDKLPKISNQIGALWGDFRKFREKLESEVRGSFPDLPDTDTITQAVRSPLSFLDNLAETHSREGAVTTTIVESTESSDIDSDISEPLSGAEIPADSVHDHGARFPMSDASGGDPIPVVHQVLAEGVLRSDEHSMN
jgi:Sec-independent protein translocase protein TatA